MEQDQLRKDGDLMDLYNLVVSAKLQKGGGGGDIDVDALSVTENGTYTASSGHAYSPVTVSVPTGVFPSGTSQITSNGMYDVTNFASASVNVPGIVPSGTSSITENGIYDITSFASVDVNVSGGGGDHDVEDAIIQKTLSGVYENSTAMRIGSNAFAYMSNLISISMANVKQTFNMAFGYCSSLHTARFDTIEEIGNFCFYSCTNLNTLYILSPSVASLANSSAFSGTKIWPKNASIYVPASLVDSYKAANVWREFSICIKAYEGE